MGRKHIVRALKVGDEIVKKPEGPWVYGSIQEIALVYRKKKEQYIPLFHVEVEGSATHPHSVVDAAGLMPHKPTDVELRHCTGEPAQRWKMQAAVDQENRSSDTQRIRIEHDEMGCFLGTANSNCNFGLVCLPQDANSNREKLVNTPALELSEASRQFPMWRIDRPRCGTIHENRDRRTTLKGGAFAQPIGPKSAGWMQARDDELSYHRWTLQCEPD